MERGFQALTLHSFTLWGVICPDSRSQTLQLAGSIQLVALSTAEGTLRVEGEGPQRMAAVHEKVLWDVEFSTLFDVFTLWSIEAWVAGAGVAPNGLDALPLVAAGHVLAGGCVAQGPLSFKTGFVIPLARGRITLDVDLHTVLVVPLVVGLIIRPVLSLFRESLIGSHPGPLIVDLSDTNPVVRAEERDDVIEVSDFILILDGH